MTEQDFEYNDEFFFDQATRDRAAKRFPRIWFALYSDKISQEFKKHDEVAKHLKSDFQKWGFRVISLAVFALSVAAVEPTFLHPMIDAGYLPKLISKALATLAGLAGVLSVLMGFFGMGFKGRKTNWLRTRLICERIRQWHWQYFCAHSLEALQAAGVVERQNSYVEKRDAEFADFITKLEADTHGALAAVLSASSEHPDATWITPNFKERLLSKELAEALDPGTIRPEGKELIDAYSNIRIGAQRRYARYLVRDTGHFQRTLLPNGLGYNRGLALLMAIFVCIS